MARLNKWGAGLAAMVVAGAAAGWVMTAPHPLPELSTSEHSADLENGRNTFLISGCASCHAEKGAKAEAKLVLEGGQRFETEFGTFIAPNISTDPVAGIGNWNETDFVNAVLRGISPDGDHYYPAFPYGSYARMEMRDVRDLWAYMQTLPASSRANEPQEIGFPFSIRRGIGVWKMLYLGTEWRTQLTEDATEDLKRGRYLVEGPGHCGECHTPRDAVGGLDPARWLAGAPNPDGDGQIPNITPAGKSVADWAEIDIVEYLTSGFTPDYDTAGGSMVSVIDNTAQLPESDRKAIAAYLKAIPAVSSD